jgi:hypothetical protein
VEKRPGNKKLPKESKPNLIGQAITNWHWLIKHPVEFSKNNHTPNRSSMKEPARGYYSFFPRRPHCKSGKIVDDPCRPADDHRSDQSAWLLRALLLYPVGLAGANSVSACIARHLLQLNAASEVP